MKIRIVTGLFLAACLLVLTLQTAIAQPLRTEAVQYYPPAYLGRFQPSMVHAPAQHFHVGSFVSGVFNTVYNHPYFAYYDATAHNLRYAHYAGPDKNRCNSVPGEWDCSIIDDGNHGADDVGKYNSIATFGGPFTNPRGWGVSYYDATHYSVKLIEYRCTTSSNCAWMAPQTVYDPPMGSAGTYGTSLKYDSQGNPYILFSFSFMANSLMLANRTTDGVWHYNTILQSNTTQKTDVGYYPSLAIYNDKLYAAFYDKGNDALWYATNFGNGPNNCTGTSLTGWTCMFIDYKIGKWSSIQVSSTGVPQIASYDSSEGKVSYAIYNGSQPNCANDLQPKPTWRCDAIETVGANLTAFGLSFALDAQDMPAIAYTLPQDQGPSALRFARPLKAYNFYTPRSSTLCGPLGQTIPIPTWSCLTLDGGDSNNDEAGAVALVMQPNGLAIVGYSEDDSYYDITRLKSTYQRLHLFLPGITY